MKDRALTCVYCGMEYPQGTPSWGNNNVLTEHIRVCEKHPLRNAEKNIAILREALIGLVGSGNKEELVQMEIALRSLPAPNSDKELSINAIHALLSTMSA